MNGLPQNPSMNGRSGRADANRPAGGRTRVPSVTSIFAHRAIGVCAPRPAIHGGNLGIWRGYSVFSTGKAAAKWQAE